MKRGKVLYLQYTNPAAYPPLEHSSHILAEREWEVLFLGIKGFNVAGLEFSPHPRITTRLIPSVGSGWRQKLHYLRYCAWALAYALRWRPTWVYASDLLSAPAALLLRRLAKVRVLYHEHDSPGDQSSSTFQRLVLRARQILAREATLCVLPNEQRIARFIAATGADRASTYCVWNCPRREEVPTQQVVNNGPLILYYHGNIGSHLLPLTLIDVIGELADHIRLRIVGYETVGTQGYLKSIRQAAQARGVSSALEIEPALPRYKLWTMMEGCAIGLVLMGDPGTNVNLHFLPGASNKVFDYLAGGLALLVPNRPEWLSSYVAPGYALACDPADRSSIAHALSWFLDHPHERAAMGELGRQRILDEWNYESQFAPVLDVLMNSKVKRS